MSTYHRAHLVYGYDLGHTEKYLIEEVGEYGSLDMPWIKRDPEGYADESLTEAIVRKLYEAIPGANLSKTEAYQQEDIVKAYYGVTVLEHGWLYESSMPSYALVAHEIECDGGDAAQVSLMNLVELEALGEMDRNLARALEVSEITPNQKRPGWLLLASR